jgi:hypothetical protein
MLTYINKLQIKHPELRSHLMLLLNRVERYNFTFIKSAKSHNEHNKIIHKEIEFINIMTGVCGYGK